MISMDHGAPVEKLLIFPKDRIIATAGGPVIKLWDITNGGRLMHVLEHHHKTVCSRNFGITNRSKIGSLCQKISKVYFWSKIVEKYQFFESKK